MTLWYPRGLSTLYRCSLTTVIQEIPYQLWGHEWVHCLLLFPLVLGKMQLSHAKLSSFCVVWIIYFRKKGNCFLFWKSNFKMALIWKKGYFWPTLHIFLVTRESYKNSFSTYISRTYIHTCILLTLLTFSALPILKKYEFIRIASLSRLAAFCLNSTSDALNNCSF